MLSKHSKDQREQLEVVALSELVPEDHLVRKMEEAMDFSFIYEKVAPFYSSKGRPSIDPVVLIKMVLIQYVFGHRSMRETIKRIETDVAYRWFIGYGFSEKVPHFSTFSKNYERRFHDTDLFETIFYKILRQAMNLKKLANWTWKGPDRQLFRRKNRIKWTKIGRIIEIRPILSTV